MLFYYMERRKNTKTQHTASECVCVCVVYTPRFFDKRLFSVLFEHIYIYLPRIEMHSNDTQYATVR